MARFDILGLQYFTDGGELLGGGKLNFYETGTTTRKNTFSDSAMTIANTNPVTLDADGRAPNIFFSGLAKCVLTDSTGVVLETKDPVGDDSASKNGFPDWAADVTYAFNQPVTASDGYIYTSLVNNNIGNDPISSPTEWQLFAQTIGFPDTPNGYVFVVDTAEPLKINAVPLSEITAMEFVSSATASASSVIDFTGLDLATYNYRFTFQNVRPVANGVFSARTSTDNGATFNAGGGDYIWGGIYGNTTLGAVGTGPSGDSINLSGGSIGTAVEGINGSADLCKSSAGAKPFVSSAVVSAGSSSSIPVAALMGGFRDSTDAINAVRFFSSGGNLTSGIISLYRITKS